MTHQQLNKAEVILKDTPQFKIKAIRYIRNSNSIDILHIENDGTDALGVFYRPQIIEYFKEFKCLFRLENDKIILHIW